MNYANISDGQVIFVILMFILWGKWPWFMWIVSGVGSGLFVIFHEEISLIRIVFGMIMISIGLIPAYVYLGKD